MNAKLNLCAASQHARTADDNLGGVAERGVEQASQRVVRVRGQLLSDEAQALRGTGGALHGCERVFPICKASSATMRSGLRQQPIRAGTVNKRGQLWGPSAPPPMGTERASPAQRWGHPRSQQLC
jgi:hypothetical protein